MLQSIAAPMGKRRGLLGDGLVTSNGSPALIIAIQPDNYTDPTTGRFDSSSSQWADLLRKAGHEVRWVNVYHAGIFDQLRGCDAFMWRWSHMGGMGQIARRILPVIERGLGLPVYPDQNTCWHYDDKIAQAYLLPALNIPTPKTWVWFDASAAREWARTASYPLVTKLATGAGSTNVRRINSFEEASNIIYLMFSKGTCNLGLVSPAPWGLGRRIRAAAKSLMLGRPSIDVLLNSWEFQKDYVLLQEFLPGNDYDTRITVIGDRAFGFRRYNRDNDFRASGSGNIDWASEHIDTRFVRLAFIVAAAIGSQSLAIDGLYRDTDIVVGEISYTYASWAVHDCPGHWELDGAPDNGALVWCDGNMWPEEAQIADFLTRLERSRSASWNGETSASLREVVHG